MDYAKGASKQLEDAGFSIPAIADHIYDEVTYTRYYLRRYGLL
jgi:hypothetical protein